LKSFVLDNIEDDYPRRLRERFEKMLNSWVKMDQDKATWGTLELALSNANRVELGLEPLLERKENMCNAI